jgi:hypothetical protein
MEESPRSEPYDAIIVGAGLCGLIFLKYAIEGGLRCLVLEKRDDVGGLWSWLPAWQDIQNRREDFSVDGVPLRGMTQPSIHEYAHEWVRRFELDSFIELGCEVTSALREEGSWTVRSTRGVFRAKYLIVASGVQNEPRIPDVDRTDSNIVELHSSAVRRPQALAGERVTVVGGGTSSWDLLDLALQNGAGEIHWVHRSTKWFLPTGGTKQNAWPNLRELSVMQSILRPGGVTAFLRGLLKLRYGWSRVGHLEPAEPFDIGKHQLIPARALMIRNLDRIARHPGEIHRLRGREVTLKGGERYETDVVLWATGWRMNLEYLGLPEYREVRTVQDLLPRLGSLVRSIDHPGMFFLGMSLGESTSSTPFFAAVEAKSIVAHIEGRCDIPMTRVPHHVAHWDLFRHFAGFDHANYPRFWWRIKYLALAVWYLLVRNRSVRI